MEVISWLKSIEGIASIFGIGAVVLGLFKWMFRRQEIELSYAVSLKTLLDERGIKLPEDIKISYKNVTVSSLVRCDLIIWNSGSKVIREGDIVPRSPIKIITPSKSLRVSLFKESSETCECELVSSSECEWLVKFRYLEPDQGMALEILTESSLPPSVVGKIIGDMNGVKRGRYYKGSFTYREAKIMQFAMIIHFAFPFIVTICYFLFEISQSLSSNLLFLWFVASMASAVFIMVLQMVREMLPKSMMLRASGSPEPLQNRNNELLDT